MGTGEPLLETRIRTVRRVLGGCGLALQKSKKRRPTIDDAGGYRILSSNRDRVVAGQRYSLTLERLEFALGTRSNSLDASKREFMLSVAGQPEVFDWRYRMMVDSDPLLDEVFHERNLNHHQIRHWWAQMMASQLSLVAELYHWPTAVLLYPIILNSFCDLVAKHDLDEAFFRQIFDHFIVAEDPVNTPLEWVIADRNNAYVR